jgi:hypothetical protein
MQENGKSRVFLDGEGVIRWSATSKEVSLFGANYCLPSACDFRAAGYVTSDRKKAIDQDMAHFARMGWDALRLCLWGDWENSDANGNLVVNDHLDLLDYLIARAKERAISMLLTPIVTYSSLYPDGVDDETLTGFSKRFVKKDLGIDPRAIAAQASFLKQILCHVNPYTKTALKDDPDILFVEMINEPHHNSEDIEGSISYINALVDAVRSTGCDKILFHNVSQDVRIAPALPASRIQGASFAWYPTGLVSGATLKGNNLRAVDDYPPMRAPELGRLGKIVYEFDHPDSLSNAMYPAMVRAFRSGGAQFATMFSYDMLVTAPYNLGWQTHFLNLVCTPNKAASAIIAGEAMRRLPRRQSYGRYPGNTSFGQFRISHEKDASELSSADAFMYSNSTETLPLDTGALRRIVGCGSSPLVSYEGRGIYFLDRIDAGCWRLEVYPDALIVADPFARQSPDRIVSRVIHHEWRMTVHLPDLGESFRARRIAGAGASPAGTRAPKSAASQAGSGRAPKAPAASSAVAVNGGLSVRPGVYILTRGEKPDPADLPDRIGRIGMAEFVCLEEHPLPVQLISKARSEYARDRPMRIAVDVVSREEPLRVTLYARRREAQDFLSYAMEHSGGYEYQAIVPAGAFAPGWFQYCVSVATHDATLTFPELTAKSPADWDFLACRLWETRIVEPDAPLPLLVPGEDIDTLACTRVREAIGHRDIFLVPGSDVGLPVLRFTLPPGANPEIEDFTVSHVIKERIACRGDGVRRARGLALRARGLREGQQVHVALVEADGTAWSGSLTLGAEWKDAFIPLSELRPGPSVLLPMGYPERWSYWADPAEGRGGPEDRPIMKNVERLQISLRSSREAAPGADPGVEVASVALVF